MRITINERKHAALSRQTVKLNALTSSPHAPQPCHHGYAPLPNWRPTRTTNTHFSATNSPTPIRHGQPNSSTHWHHNPPHHNPHFTTINPFPHQHGPHTPPPTPNRPTLQPHSNPSGQADSAHQTENSLKLPVVGSQHTESEILPGAAVQQRNGKDTPMACQRASFLNTFRRGSQRADVALAGRHRRALLRWDVPRIGGPDRRTLGGQYRANRLAGRTPSARCTPGRGRK